MLSLFVFINNFKEREIIYIYSFLTLCLQYLVYMKFSVVGKLPTYKTLLNNLNCPLTSQEKKKYFTISNEFVHNIPTS